MTFPAGFPIVLACGKLAGTIVNGNCRTAGCCNHHKGEPVAKPLACDPVTVVMLGCLELQGLVISTTHEAPL